MHPCFRFPVMCYCLFKCSGIKSAQDALLHLILLLFAGKSAEQRAAQLQKQIEAQDNTLQSGAVAAAHGMHQPFDCCSTMWCMAGPMNPCCGHYILVATVTVMKSARATGLRTLSVLRPTTWATQRVTLIMFASRVF